MNDIKDIYSRVKNLAGILYPEHRKALIQASLDTSGFKIEIGCLIGLSTCCIALSSSDTDHIISVDPFRIEYLSDMAKGVVASYSGKEVLNQEGFFSSWEHQVNKICPGKTITPVIGDRIDQLPRVKEILGNEKAGLLFIDGLHNYESVRKDIDTYLPLTKLGGLVAFHDHSNEYPGVVQAVKETLNDGRLEIFRNGYLLTTRKINER